MVRKGSHNPTCAFHGKFATQQMSLDNRIQVMHYVAAKQPPFYNDEGLVHFACLAGITLNLRRHQWAANPGLPVVESQVAFCRALPPFADLPLYMRFDPCPLPPVIRTPDMAGRLTEPRPRVSDYLPAGPTTVLVQIYIYQCVSTT